MDKKEFDGFLQKLNISKKDLAELVSMPYNTVNGWNGDTKPYPSWLKSWFEHYEKSTRYEKIKELTKDL